MRAQPSNAIYLVVVAVVVIVLLIIFLQLLRGISNYNVSSSTNFSSEIVKTTFTAYYCFSNNVCSKFNSASNSWYMSYAGSSGSALLNSSITFFSTKGNYTYTAPTLFLNGQYICPSSPTGQAEAGSNVSIYYSNQYCKFYDVEIYVSNLPSNVSWSLYLVNSTSKLNYSYSGDRTLNFYALGGTQEDFEFYINNYNNSICYYKYSFSITLYPGQYLGSGSVVSFSDFVSSNQTI
ncbi:MAG: hypothetical protein QXX36_03010, partial [Candidatus Rehaiarchaeum fermentans]|nr:hypothetical protein [Candidatus Rehaiarchaeum fermentans]